MQIGQLINNLKTSGMIAQCPMCEDEFRLSDALLFDGMKKFPEAAEERKLLLQRELEERKEELKLAS